MKKFLLLALVLMVAFAAPAMAEVQNVKVGGDINVMHVAMGELDLDDTVGNSNTNHSTDNYFMTITRIYMSADLTDNVQAYIRLTNERDWDAQDNAGGNTTSENDVELDLSYIKLSEFLYSPLTVKVGRQEIWWGSHLVVGAGTNTPANSTHLRNSYLSKQYAFDAVRAMLDYDPWTIDMFWAKVDEDEEASATGGSNEEDEDLAGIQISYVWPSEWLTEGYYVYNADKDTTVTPLSSEVHTVGLRAEGAVAPIDEKLYIEAEIAYQWGDYSVSTDIKAWAGILGATYSFDNEYKPVIGIKYDYRSGEPGDASGDYENWNAAYSYNLIGHIIDKVWMRGYNQNTATDPRGAGGNIHALTTSGSFMPFEDIEVGLEWIWAKADEKQITATGVDDEIGHEIIGTVTYDYTEDVTIGVKGCYFNPDDAFRTNEDDAAYEIISSVSVEF